MDGMTQPVRSRRDVVVLLGGTSAERDVSLSTGKGVVEALITAGYQVRAVDHDGDARSLIAALEPRPDAVFNALHGRGGEDGTIQALLDMLQVPYTHSGVLASALAMNKPAAKRLFAGAGLRCPEGKVVERSALGSGDPIARPFVVKPPNEGSSVGVRIVREGDNEPFDQGVGAQVLVEEYIAGREVTVAVMGRGDQARALGALEIRPRTGFYDYTAKYTDGQAEHLVPAPLPPPVYAQALDMAVTAHRALGCRGVSRADFRYDDTSVGPGVGPGTLYLLEVNTQPGMTPLSLLPEIAAAAGIDFPSLVAWMVEDASWGD